ncbi:NANO1 protein, partial [Urocynchramus pylzowi]|nr:NANO1 protein [Urocynchramus pylzowi]
MEAFPGTKLEQHRHLPPVECLPGARYAGRSHSACGNVFNSWNDYLGLATLITKAVRPGKGFGPEPPLDLHDLELCGHPPPHHHPHHHGEGLLEERFADFSPFPGRGGPAAVVFDCSGEHPGREGSAHAWGGVVVAGRLAAHPRGASPPVPP